MERVKSGVLYLLRFNATANGHTCLPEELLYPAAIKLLGTTEELAHGAVSALLQEDKLRQMRVRTERAKRCISLTAGTMTRKRPLPRA